jgi:hypothetical protein
VFVGARIAKHRKRVSDDTDCQILAKSVPFGTVCAVTLSAQTVSYWHYLCQ